MALFVTQLARLRVLCDYFRHHSWLATNYPVRVHAAISLDSLEPSSNSSNVYALFGSVFILPGAHEPLEM